MLPNTIVSNLIWKLSNKCLSGHTLSIKNDTCFPQSGKGLRYLIFQMIQVAIHQFCLSPGKHITFWINDNFYSSVYYCSSNHIDLKHRDDAKGEGAAVKMQVIKMVTDRSDN